MADDRGLKAASAAKDGELSCGDLSLNRFTFRVYRRGRELSVGPTEFRLLEFFIANQGSVLTRAQIVSGLWGEAAAVEERTIDVHVGRLRRILTHSRAKDPIETVRGAGYRMRAMHKG